MAEKYDTVAERVKKAMPTIERMADMAAARAAWVEQPLPAMEPHELVSVTIAPPVA